MRFDVTLNFSDDEFEKEIEAPTPLAAVMGAEVLAGRKDWTSWVIVHSREPGE